MVDEVIPYCFRLVNYFEGSPKTSVHPLSQKLSFEELRLAHTTSEQLLSWSISIDVAQRYQFYLIEPNAAFNEVLYNCTEPWFGPRCQYSFPFGGRKSFNQIVEAAFRQRTAFPESSEVTVQVPCYVLLECHRNGQSWCLDWREVCNGIVDCFDDAVDEEYCFDMEINECEKNEYRCHNGLCISSELWEAGEGNADCLDRSDEVLDAFYIKSCFQDPTFRCEEHSCRTHEGTFPCGDGQCVETFDACYNGRHILLIESMTAKGNLTDECWIAMICLTKLAEQIHGSSCKIWLMNASVYEFLEQCDSFFQFPTIPVHSGYIRFFYEEPYLRQKIHEFLPPDYLCYNQQLCDFIKSDLIRENLTCINMSKLMLNPDIEIGSWNELMWLIEQVFRPCLISHVVPHNKIKKYLNHSLLYNCRNSSKFISVHRIKDGIQDCFQDDDEKYLNSCQLNRQYRVKCQNIDICWSPILKEDACSMTGQDENIPFQRFCNGINQSIYYANFGKYYNDEFECEEWLCNNMYARCDGFWGCADGRDENNCSRTKCHSGTHACVDPVNFTVICLPHTRVNDGNDDCLGASDEQHECQRIFPPSEVPERFRCSRDTMCLVPSELCNNNNDCPFDDDEKFCRTHQFNCTNDSTYNRSEIEEVLCGLSEQENRREQYFSVHTSSNYPSLGNTVVDESLYWSTERNSIENINIDHSDVNTWPWYCNRGLIIHLRSESDSFDNVCMCPSSYYGHLCQYQNQRISLTLHSSSVDRHATYAIIIMLIDDNDEQQEITAYDQFVYITKDSCSTKFNRYLLFPTRPKDLSSNYSIRIDAFEKNSITYVGSWHFPITFLFLPVNRIAVSLMLSNHIIQTSFNCLITCNSGTCVKYINTERYFCRCYSQWTGVQCNIPINRQMCSHDSFYLGLVNNQSICVCPLHKFGSQCMFTSACPTNICQNNGTCIPADVTTPDSSYTCVCPDQFFGVNCQYAKVKLDVSLIDMHIPSYLAAYFFTLSNKSDPMQAIILRKLTLFQHTATFHISVPFHMVVIQSSGKYYLAVLQQSLHTNITTSIRPSQECIPAEQLLNSTVMKMVQYRRIIFFHILCHTRSDLMCFIDPAYLCLCTSDRHANCMEFKRDRNFQCSLTKHCANGAQCVQDHPFCPSTRICICPACFFGEECQFYTKGLGSTLDEILGYELKRNTILSKQPITVKVSAAITMIIFAVGLINCILSIMVCRRPASQKVGCGIYLLIASYNSITIMILLILKFWLLFFSYQLVHEHRTLQIILFTNCRVVEPLLKVLLNIDKWLNACVSIERIVSVHQGISFNTEKSKTIARYAVIVVFLINFGVYVLPIIKLHVFTDNIEERSWCVITYSSFMQTYNFTSIVFHYIGPLATNVISAITIIIITARQRYRTAAKTNPRFKDILKIKIKQYKHLIISPIIIIFLTVPHLIISFILKCNKSPHLLWFYLLGYFLSFIPSTFIFLIFILPAPVYRKEFIQIIAYIRRRFDIMKLNASGL
ncbi:unnamed protein product [Adineta steineri]|uniref:Uncharacterized protein n=1 Tax=Adineta steineri TaxID=433720 RepID=A0A814CGE9_9BILA|nr:unnamed protein product [Adineta steineri]